MNSLIKILDCTLRDGGYVNNWEFSTESTKEIITSLIDAKVDIIECGFVSQKNGLENNSTMFKSVEQVEIILKSIDRRMEFTEFCVMINRGEYDLSTLPVYDPESNVINMIRYAFHKMEWKEAVDDIKLMIEKGYKVYVQAMVTLSYTDSEILSMLEEMNKYDIYAMYIVDSFGAMLGDDFRRLHYLFENNLKDGVCLGYHSHNNLQLAYSNAIDFIQIKATKRQIIIDSSIHGMGRGAGNLTTELLADYLNKKKHAEYNIVPLLETIDRYLEVIYRENYWGYSIAHFLSASFGCHPNYATFLVNTKTLSIVDMQKILTLLDKSEKKNFSSEKIKELYIDFKSKLIQNNNFEEDQFKDKEILVVASGPNSEKQKDRVLHYIDEYNPIVISVNHIPASYTPDYIFFSNQKRFDKFELQLEEFNVIVTSNIKVKSLKEPYWVVDYHDLAVMTSNKNDNVTVLLLNLLINQDVKKVLLVGLDGYRFDSENYSYMEFDRIVERKELQTHNNNIETSLEEIRLKLSLHFLTDSIFDKS
jgi:4-hydroxy 2-oxovalerate aldolase